MMQEEEEQQPDMPMGFIRCEVCGEQIAESERPDHMMAHEIDSRPEDILRNFQLAHQDTLSNDAQRQLGEIVGRLHQIRDRREPRQDNHYQLPPRIENRNAGDPQRALRQREAVERLSRPRERVVAERSASRERAPANRSGSRERARANRSPQPQERRPVIHANRNRANNRQRMQRQSMTYEEMLALDGDPYARGNGLEEAKAADFPTYVMTVESKENWAVWMDKIMPGETAKRLNCMHEFHKDWIDEWLSRSPTCPIDKQQFN